jgi:TolB-like protein
VFLTEHGVKLLDFGLARPAAASDAGGHSDGDLTRPGMLVGTPRYMAPEQIDGEELGPVTDVFATGALLFEMLAGRPAFGGKRLAEILHAALHEQPPALAGSPDAVAVDRVIRRALEKAPGRRYPTAKAMAADLRAITLGGDTSAPTLTLKRLVVLPFRALRPDPDTDFLSYGLAEGLSMSLAGFRSLVVRSTAAAARLAVEPLELKRIATECGVDLVVTGSVLRAGERLRVTVQLVEASSGTVVGSHTVEPEMGDVIRLQDDVTRSIVEFLSPTLSGRAGSARRNVAATAAAQELYLRATQAVQNYERFLEARDLYERCVGEDPDFAPAWAHLGRCDRLIGKYMGKREEKQEQAEAAFKRALEIDAHLPVAHKHYAQLEAETGRATTAIARLIRAADASPNDAEIFAGLVHSCRYAGLLEASLAAHDEARRLDPHIATGLAWTLLARGEYERLAALREQANALFDPEPQLLALVSLGRLDEARLLHARREKRAMPEVLRVVTGWVAPLLAGDPQGTIEAIERALAAFYDPEANFIFSLVLLRAGQVDRGLEVLRDSIAGGFNPAGALGDEVAFDPVRGQATFEGLRRTVDERRAEALATYRSAGGERLLGI